MIKNNEMTIKDEEIKVKKFREENERRQFNNILSFMNCWKLWLKKDMYNEACEKKATKKKKKERIKKKNK